MEKTPRPAGKAPRFFAKAFSGLPKDMTEEAFQKLEQFTPDKIFGEGPFDYLTLHRPGPKYKTDAYWVSMNWSRSYAEGLKLKWSVLYKEFEAIREDNVHSTYGGGEGFKYAIYCVVWADANAPLPPWTDVK